MLLRDRKTPRAKWHDYKGGEYFVTICTKDRVHFFGEVYGGEMRMTSIGKMLKQEIEKTEKIRGGEVSIPLYVIMPNHIHAIMILNGETAGASPRPTLTDIVCTYKSLTTRECKKHGFDGKLFQTSFYEHIIRGREDYEEITKYIYENPIRWYYDELYTEE